MSTMELDGNDAVSEVFLAVNGVEQDGIRAPECNARAYSGDNRITIIDPSSSAIPSIDSSLLAEARGNFRLLRGQYQNEIDRQIQGELNAAAGYGNPHFSSANSANRHEPLVAGGTVLPVAKNSQMPNQIVVGKTLQGRVSKPSRKPRILAPFSSRPHPSREHQTFASQLAKVPTNQDASTRVEGWLGDVEPAPLIDMLLHPRANNAHLAQDVHRVAKEQVRRSFGPNQESLDHTVTLIRHGIKNFEQFGEDSVKAGSMEGTPNAPMPATFPDNVDEELDELYWALGRLPKQVALMILRNAAAITKCIIKMPGERKRNLVDDIEAQNHHVTAGSVPHPGDHPRWSFQDGNFTQHPRSQIIDIIRYGNISGHDYKMLVVDTYNQLYQLGEVRRLPILPNFPGVKFEIIPYIEFNAIFSGSWANIDGKIVPADEVWDMTMIGVPKTMELYYAHFENRFT